MTATEVSATQLAWHDVQAQRFQDYLYRKLDELEAAETEARNLKAELRLMKNWIEDLEREVSMLKFELDTI